jgi:hypothetical protein
MMDNWRNPVAAAALSFVAGLMMVAAAGAQTTGPFDKLIAPNAAEGPKDPVAPELIKLGLKRWESVKTFGATFIRRERLADQTELGEVQVILLRERQKPFSIYMQWVDGLGKGRQLVYVEGLNNGKFRVTPGGSLGFVVMDLAVDDPQVFKSSRHSVLDAGMGNLLRKIDKQFALAGPDVRTKYKGKTAVGGRTGYLFYRYMPEKPQCYCWKSEIVIDEELHFPLSVKVFDWKGQPFEEYTYKDIQIDPDYTDKCFEIQPDQDKK